MTWPPALDALVRSLALHPDSRIMILTVIQRDLADALRGQVRPEEPPP
jgi:hypothetical protein